LQQRAGLVLVAGEVLLMSWIKVECSTPNKPEVLKLARIMGVSRDDAFGKAMRFWIWLDGITVDGVVDGVTSHDVDAVVGAVGIADALVSAGWLQISDDGQTIAVPNFDRHNGESAKARGLKTKRQAKWRAGRVDDTTSTGPSTSESTREEKSIIEETDLVLCKIPDCLDTQEFRNAWTDWLKHSQHVRGQNLSEQHQQTKLADFMQCGVTEAIRDIRHSIAINAKNVHSKCKPKESDGKPQPKIDGERVATMAEFRAAYGCKEET
jgi:hypothetical protein